MDKEKIKWDERYKIMGAVFEVYNKLGVGFTEFVYQDALEVEFSLRNIPFEKEKKFIPLYKGVLLKHHYSVDFMCYGDIIVECKAVDKIVSAHIAQTLNYKRLSDAPTAILVNFGANPIEYYHYV